LSLLRSGGSRCGGKTMMPDGLGACSHRLAQAIRCPTMSRLSCAGAADSALVRPYRHPPRQLRPACSDAMSPPTNMRETTICATVLKCAKDGEMVATASRPPGPSCWQIFAAAGALVDPPTICHPAARAGSPCDISGARGDQGPAGFRPKMGSRDQKEIKWLLRNTYGT